MASQKSKNAAAAKRQFHGLPACAPSAAMGVPLHFIIGEEHFGQHLGMCILSCSLPAAIAESMNVHSETQEFAAIFF
ncbi:MAG: hypothetical protein ACOYD9_01120 [Pyramidobacter sp.]